ncbi:MAG: hypothetical protein ABFD84_05860, partial [Candidatus Polarisedimenticolia bacterium]
MRRETEQRGVRLGGEEIGRKAVLDPDDLRRVGGAVCAGDPLAPEDDAARLARDGVRRGEQEKNRSDENGGDGLSQPRG